MLNAKDLEQLSAKGISKEKIEEQLACFEKGFPFLEIEASASVEKGICVVPADKQPEYMDAWDAYLTKNKRILKFVPASGAASRMFKNLFAFLSADYDEPTTDFEKKFFADIRKFAFYQALNQKCEENTSRDIPALMASGEYKKVVANLLEKEGLNYGSLPKGLLLFHTYPDSFRTAMEEHLAEGAMYAKNNAGEVNIHFTVSPEHKAFFEQLVAEKAPAYENKFSVKYDISFSVQKPSTDTIAVNMDNTPFRDKDGKLLFIDHTGKVVIDKGLEVHREMSAYAFHDGYCLIKNPVDGKIGLINRKGDWALMPEYLDIRKVDSLWIVENDNGEDAILDNGMKTILPFAKVDYSVTDEAIFATLQDHTICRYSLKGELVDDSYITYVEPITYQTDKLYYGTMKKYDEEGNVESEVTDTEPYYTQAVARCRRYQAEYGWYGLMSSGGVMITPPAYSSITAVGEDLYLCQDEEGHGVLLNGKGERIESR